MDHVDVEHTHGGPPWLAHNYPISLILKLFNVQLFPNYNYRLGHILTLFEHDSYISLCSILVFLYRHSIYFVIWMSSTFDPVPHTHFYYLLRWYQIFQKKRKGITKY